LQTFSTQRVPRFTASATGLRMSYRAFESKVEQLSHTPLEEIRPIHRKRKCRSLED
jgi:hypothetical protein